MKVIDHKSNYLTNICNSTINSYSDLYIDQTPNVSYISQSESITKPRVFPHRYIDKHIWKTYGYNTTYNSSFEDKTKIKKTHSLNKSIPTMKKERVVVKLM